MLSLLILGRRVAFPAHLVGDREHCGLAEWLLDKTSKNFVLMLSRLRQALLGSLRICGGRLMVVRGKFTVNEVLLQQGSYQASQVAPRLALYSGWVPPVARSICWAKGVPSRGPFPFYVVWRGRSIGVKYKWSSVRSSVAGLSSADSAFKGFASLEEASYAFSHAGFW